MAAPHTALFASDSVNALTEPGQRGVVRVLGGPGTGKTELLIDTAATHIAAGADPESVLLLTGSARLGARVRGAVTARLLGDSGEVTREPLVRTLHSYAFAVLRLAAQRAGDPPPRLITSAEQDGIIRELLAGDLEDGDDASVNWPLQLRPALATAGFATELRDLLARCTERGVDAAELRGIGRRNNRPEWVAAGRFAQVYEQVMLLRSAVGMAAPQATVPALGAAELVGAALDAFALDPELLAAERSRIKLLLVDDAQHLDPQAALLVRVLAAGVELTVIAGDPDQTVFGYRGADPTLLRDDNGRPTVVLTESHRCAPAVARAVSAVAARLPGAGAGRMLTAAPGDQDGSVSVRIAGTLHAESALIADALRRAHLIDGTPWNQMAVIVRSVPRAGTALARALTAAGVPVQRQGGATPPGEHPAVAALLTVLDSVADELTADRAMALLTGPIGRVDPVTLRQLRRALRRADGAAPPREFGDLLIDALRTDVELPAALARSLRRVRGVLNAAGQAARTGQDPRFVLWQAWHHSGLQRRWLPVSQRTGAAAVAAGRDLDAVTALFDIAEQYVARTAAASPAGLVDHVRALAWVGSRDEDGDGVAVLSAHAALGREWNFVVIAGLQEGLWPNTIPRGGVLATGQLLDIVDGVGAINGMSATAPLLAEERRLLIGALGRARGKLLVTAVDSDTGDEALLPSPFCEELLALATDDAEPATERVIAPAVLSPAALVGRLRAVVCAPADSVDEQTRAHAATQLARLAAAGVAGSDPAQWHSSVALSTEDKLSTEDALRQGDTQTVTLSPSTLQTLVDCPLRWMLERHGGGDGRDLRSALGSLVHALVADSGRSDTQLAGELEKHWGKLPFDSRWYSDNELARHRDMLETFTTWRRQTRGELTEVATELDVAGPVAADSELQVLLRGRVDRLERDGEGRLVVIDVKTGKSAVTKADAQRHAQLALYQLAIAEGVVAHGDQPGGGRLVYPAKPSARGATERHQDPMGEQAQDEWQQRVLQAAKATGGPQFLARINDGCAHCPVRPMCPAQGTKGACR